MTRNVCRLISGGTTLDLNDFSSRVTVTLQPGMPNPNAVLAHSPLSDGAELAFTAPDVLTYAVTWHEVATSNTNLVNGINAIERLLKAARSNQRKRNNDQAYTPVYFEHGLASATNVTRTEVIYGFWQGSRDGYMGMARTANILENNSLNLICRPFIDATALVSAVGSTALNNGSGNSVAFSGILGIEDAPSQIQVDTISAGADDRLIVGMRTLGTPTNFVGFYEAEGASLTDAVDTALVTSGTEASFSPGASNVGIGFTPVAGTPPTHAGTTEVLLGRITNSTNVSDQYGFFKVFARVKAKVNTNISLRLRGFVQSGSLARQYGPYTTIYGVAPTNFDDIEMIDLTPIAPLQIPCIPARGNAVSTIGFELWGKASALATNLALRIDYLLLIPVGEGDGGRGGIDVTFPVAIKSTGVNSAIIDSRDFQVKAGLYSSTPTLLYTASNRRGAGVWLPTSGRLYFVLITSTNNVHAYATTYNVTVQYLSRYDSMRGTA